MKNAIVFLLAMFMTLSMYAQKGLPIDQLAKDGITIKEDVLSIVNAGTYKIKEVMTSKQSGKYPDVWVFFVASDRVYSISVKKADDGKWLYAIGKRKV